MKFIRRVLESADPESADPGASNGGSDNKIRPFGTDLARFEKIACQMIGNNSCDFFQILEQFDRFKSAENGFKWLDFNVRPTMGCAKVGTFQRTFNQRHTTHLRA